ncbi:MAG: hypothetical protein PG981_000215 [Wolbachia endosymbiont of Ctenocephalides orientis wCori]|nr:MAG: hypothetical protein PG981_000215 [Wolbachia endosymbiont of Ctenocephalides orientis wCori]
MINKAKQCKSVTSLGQFIAKHDVAFQIVSGLLLTGVVASCVYGFPFAAISLLIAGAFVFELSTNIGWRMCERVSSKVSSSNAEQAVQTAEIVS